MKSTTDGPVRIGGPSMKPVVLMTAVRAWMVRSMAGWPAYGPNDPNPVPDAMINLGLSWLSLS